MRKDLANGHFVATREVGNEPGDGIIEREFALLGKENDSGSSKLFADGADAVPHLRPRRSGRVKTGLTVGLEVSNLSILHDGDGGAENARAAEGFTSDGVDLGLQV